MKVEKQNLTVKAQEVLNILIEGNKRFQKGKSRADLSESRRIELLKGQHPIATVLTCSDSRVVPEYIFDQGLGNLFVVRSAGEVIDDIILASIEYGVEHLQTPLLVILGHTFCGAIDASLEDGELHGHLPLLVEKIKPSVNACQCIPHESSQELKIDIIIENILEIKEILPLESKPIQEALEGKLVCILGAVYDMESGEVDFDLSERSHREGFLSEPHHLNCKCKK